MKYLNVPLFNPIIIDLPGPLALSWYGFMYFLGVVFVYVFVIDHIRRKKISLSKDQFGEILIRIFMGVLVGGRLGFVFFVNPAYYLRNPLQIFAIWEGGMYFFGGFLLAVLFPIPYARKQGMHPFDLADLVIIPVPIALACGRIGNFINGEFWGRVSASPLAMIFDSVPESAWLPTSEAWVREMAETAGIDTAGGLVNLPRHPVQLYEFVLEGLVLYVILLLFRNVGREKPRGSVFSLFLLLYGLFRFWVEFYREPVSHSRFIGGDWFTLGMFFTIPMILGGIAGLVLSYRRRQRNELYIKIKAKKPKRKHESEK